MRIPSFFPPASEAYNCTPHPAPFNVTSSGHLVTNGLTLQDSMLYSCYNKDIDGVLRIDLLVQGLPPLSPKITTVKFSDRNAQYIYVEWTNVATSSRPVQRYTLNWKLDQKGSTVDKRQFDAENHTISTTNNYHYVSYSRGDVFTFTVYASNEAGRSALSPESIFNVDNPTTEPITNERLGAWIIVLIVILILLCCICCICCFICLCCLCARRRRRDYPAEEKGKILVTILI